MNLNFTEVQKCNLYAYLLFYVSIVRYSLGVCLLYMAGLSLWQPVRLNRAPLSEVQKGAKILAVCPIFCPKYFVCKFLHFSASNLN
jgi:hypothetical protein